MLTSGLIGKNDTMQVTGQTTSHSRNSCGQIAGLDFK